MKEKPILFSSEMVKAILDGRKTQTRRVIKPQPPESALTWVKAYIFGKPCPYGRTGDWLTFLCTWAAPKEYDKVKPSRLPKNVRIWSLFDRSEKPAWCGRLRPGRFMPKWMRAQMPRGFITAISVERVQDITLYEIAREGVMWPGETMGKTGYFEHEYPKVFARLWDSINAKRGFGWDANPWVWVISFVRVNTAHIVFEPSSEKIRGKKAEYFVIDDFVGGV